MRYQKKKSDANIYDLSHLINLVFKTKNNNHFYNNCHVGECQSLTNFISEYSLGLKSLKKKYSGSQLNQTIINLIFKKLLMNYQIKIIEFFKLHDNFLPQVSDFLKEMSREIIYCQVHQISYNNSDLYKKSYVTLTESTLHKHPCPQCQNCVLESVREACTDLYCPGCKLKVEVKSKNYIKNTSNCNIIIVNSGIPEGVTEWKNQRGKLIIFTPLGYYIVNASDVFVHGYINQLQSDWVTNPDYMVDTTKKTKLTFKKNKMIKLNLKIDFKWSDYAVDIAEFLNNLIKYLNINKSNFDHFKAIEKSIIDFEKKIYK